MSLHHKEVSLTAHGVPSRHSNPRPQCPHCTSRYVMRNRDDLSRSAFECKKCHTKFYVAVLAIKPAALIEKINVALPVREREFRPLKRDPFAHMRLCMAARR